MLSESSSVRRSYVLDTNVLIHDPSCIFRFHEHSIIIPMTVLEELDHLKVGHSDVAQSARQATRLLSGLLERVPQSQVCDGVPIVRSDNDEAQGRLFFSLIEDGQDMPGISDESMDNRIIAEARVAQAMRPGERVVVVSKDINLRVKCAALGIRAEDYLHDMVLSDSETMSDGIDVMGADFWQEFGDGLESWQEHGRHFYRLHEPRIAGWHPGMMVCESESAGFEAIVRECAGDTAVIEVLTDYRHERNQIWGAQPRNARQNFALNLLLDPVVDLVTLAGVAGTGKTFLALAAGLHQVFEMRRFEKMIITRETVSMGNDIGFLPGTEVEKMEPWMGAIHDNMESLLRSENGWVNDSTKSMLSGRIQLKSPSFMRGRTFNDTLLIIDEVQNISPKQVRGLVTRAGRGSKVICLGNVNQIDTPYLNASSCGLSFLAQRFRSWPHAAHVTLTGVERSRLAEEAERVL